METGLSGATLSYIEQNNANGINFKQYAIVIFHCPQNPKIDRNSQYIGLIRCILLLAGHPRIRMPITAISNAFIQERKNADSPFEQIERRVAELSASKFGFAKENKDNDYSLGSHN